MTIPRIPDDVMTIAELSAYLRVHSSTVYRLLKQGALPGFKIGFDWRALRSAIDSWMRAETKKQTGVRL